MTIVLIGSETWKRKHVDWEISSSIRDTKSNSRNGLLGIILPTYPGKYNHCTIPPRLYDNVKCRFAKIHHWKEDPSTVQNWIHKAFTRRTLNPDNTRDLFSNNRSSDGWC